MSKLHAHPDSQINSLASNARLNGFLCGNFLEVCWQREGTPKGQECAEQGSHINTTQETSESVLARSAARSRREVRRLCNTNQLFFMHTLTFAVRHITYYKNETPFVLVGIEDQKSREKVIAHWKVFARRLRRQEESKGTFFRYIAVIERHTGKRTKDTTIKLGTYHIHFVSDKLYHKRKLQKLWKHGLCNHSDWTKGRKKKDLDKTDTLPPPDNPGAYLSKYIGKDSELCEANRKRYWVSRNLDRPIPMAGKELSELACSGKTIYYNPTYFGKESEDADRIIVRQNWTVYLKNPPISRRKPKSKREQVYRLNKIRFEQNDHVLRLKRRIPNENLHRGTGETVVSNIITRDWVHLQQGRTEDEGFKIRQRRTISPVQRRRERVAARHFYALKKALGSRRAEQYLRTEKATRFISTN